MLHQIATCSARRTSSRFTILVSAGSTTSMNSSDIMGLIWNFILFHDHFPALARLLISIQNQKKNCTILVSPLHTWNRKRIAQYQYLTRIHAILFNIFYFELVGIHPSGCWRHCSTSKSLFLTPVHITFFFHDHPILFQLFYYYPQFLNMPLF